MQASELVMILGRSGAGKTTLLSLIGALDRPDSGSINVAGVQVETLVGRARDRFLQVTVGWVFQTADSCRCSRRRRTSNCPFRSPKFDPSTIADRATEALATVELEDRRAHTASELSGGEQHRVALARALAKRPSVVIADEPTAQLDSETAGGIVSLLATMARTGTAVLHGHARHCGGCVGRSGDAHGGRPPCRLNPWQDGCFEHTAERDAGRVPLWVTVELKRLVRRQALPSLG